MQMLYYVYITASDSAGDLCGRPGCNAPPIALTISRLGSLLGGILQGGRAVRSKSDKPRHSQFEKRNWFMPSSKALTPQASVSLTQTPVKAIPTPRLAPRLLGIT